MASRSGRTARMGRSYKPKAKARGSAPAMVDGRPGELGAMEWERLHGRTGRPADPPFAGLGWTWQPEHCEHRPGHYIRTDDATRRRRS